MTLINIPNGFLATIACSASKGFDSPSALTADTRKRYSLPGVRPVTSRSVRNNLTFNISCIINTPSLCKWIKLCTFQDIKFRKRLDQNEIKKE